MARLIGFLLCTSAFAGCGGAPTEEVIDPPTAANLSDAAPSTGLGVSDAAAPNSGSDLVKKRSEVGDRWKSASPDKRRELADVRTFHSLFQGATKAQVEEALGAADESGVDTFGEDVMRYELGTAPESEGGGSYHLTFVFENDAVVRVMGNFISL